MVLGLFKQSAKLSEGVYIYFFLSSLIKALLSLLPSSMKTSQLLCPKARLSYKCFYSWVSASGKYYFFICKLAFYKLPSHKSIFPGFCKYTLLSLCLHELLGQLDDFANLLTLRANTCLTSSPGKFESFLH